ncbi:MAG: hypothetical protein CBC12_00180 [Candidatus Puniceispirillum sp. TMED52]|nr:MAG: hypothetical protein CBC12_00180 [Candidatus Puniceispirillum sp. TMED52]
MPDIDNRLSNFAMPTPVSVRYFKTSPEIMQLAVMPYVRFPLSLRNVTLIMKFGIIVQLNLFLKMD